MALTAPAMDKHNSAATSCPLLGPHKAAADFSATGTIGSSASRVTDKAENPYAVKLAVVTEDRTGQLAALTNTIANIKTNIRNASTDDEVLNDGTRRIDLTVDVNDLQHLERVVNALKGVEGVIEVERLNVAAFVA